MDVNLTSAQITATNCFSEALKTVIKVCFWMRIRHLNFLKDLCYPFLTSHRELYCSFSVTLIKQKLHPVHVLAKIYMAGLLMDWAPNPSSAENSFQSSLYCEDPFVRNVKSAMYLRVLWLAFWAQKNLSVT